MADLGSSDANQTGDPLGFWRQRQHESWSRGQRLHVEELLGKEGLETLSPEQILELILAEVTLREELKESPTADEYCQRFPAQAGPLRRLLSSNSALASERSRENAATPLATEAPNVPKRQATITGPARSNRLGPYQLVQELGRGGMGTVYKAVHQHLGKQVAVKLIHERDVNKAEVVARFQREMKFIGKLDHPHIVRALDAGVIDGVYYLTMEYVDGTNLSQIVRRSGPLSTPAACEVVHQVCSALAAAHAAGVVHRDLKPSNLLVDNQGQVKLADLGLARTSADAPALTSDLTAAGQVIGTPDFMAPEQWESSGVADERTDLYALGCTLYYLLSGRPPYSGDEYKSLMQKMRGHVADPVPDLLSVRPEVTEAVAAVCGRLLSKDPRQRYQTADEVAKAVSAFRDNGAMELQERCALVLAERETSAEPEDSGTSIALETEAMPASPARQAPSRHAVFGRPMRATAAMVLLLSIACGTWFAFRGRAPAPDPPGGGASWDVWPSDKRELPAGWSRRKSALVSKNGVVVNNLKLGRLPSPNYRVEMDFVLEHAYDSLYVMLPLGLRHCFCAIYSYPQREEEIAWSGFGEIDGQKIPLNPSGKSGPVLRQRSPHRLEIDVRLVGNEARLSAVLDGTPLTAWNGPVASLSVPMSYEWPETDLFGIGTINASYRIDRLRVMPLVTE